MGCGRISRRTFLADTGMGFTGLALGALLQREGIAQQDDPAAWRPPDGRPHFKPRAKSVIWLFMTGGVSHVESFDPKAALNQYAGKSISDTPYKDTLSNPAIKDIHAFRYEDFTLNGYDPHPAIKAPIAV